MSVKKIYLIRHGQTDFNVRGIVQGSGVDSSLNEAGRRQAAQFFAAYGHIPFDKVYTSKLQRTHQSVQGFLDLGLPHEQHGGINEISWGIREGTRITPEEDEEYYSVLQQWRAGQTATAMAGGESPDEVAARQRPFIELLTSRPEEETVLVCMHGRAMRVLLCQLLGYPLSQMDSFEHHNLCLYKLHYTGSLFTVRSFLDMRHLQQPGL
ncbi:histidine phosphatase family protein [Hymenobacter lutimineralis]|uniref:Histidine phosphatase family protein n=1 Tax=Hymenobacter lutimineralis TaxID=2606448 RepID=A0A5D6UWC3_9BACT|nr:MULTISPECIES: histidine phosphatase family protein [Hymenobacter]QIX60499.1 histidine phosphatase family protein [Hymenobacter sp. BT18]TYZ07380.1 histidine phosphatase family protein [Hymenobacter lutimineralis]